MRLAREGLAHAAPVDEELLLEAAPPFRAVVHGRVEHNFQDLELGLQALLQFLSGRAEWSSTSRPVVARLVHPAAPQHVEGVVVLQPANSPSCRVRTPRRARPTVALPPQQSWSTGPMYQDNCPFPMCEPPPSPAPTPWKNEDASMRHVSVVPAAPVTAHGAARPKTVVEPPLAVELFNTSRWRRPSVGGRRGLRQLNARPRGPRGRAPRQSRACTSPASPRRPCRGAPRYGTRFFRSSAAMVPPQVFAHVHE